MSPSTLFAAKSNRDGLWECVPQHLEDTARVMQTLCDPEKGWVSPAFIRAAGMSRETMTRVCVFMAAIHDIGKCTPAFQKMIADSLPGLRERLLSAGYTLKKTDTCPGHALLSGAILHERFGINESICEVVAAHHGTPRDTDRTSFWKHPFKKHKIEVCGVEDEYEPIWQETVSRAEAISGICCTGLPDLTAQAQIILSGLLIIADWIASNERFFPLYERWDTSGLNDTERAKRGVSLSGVRRGWYPDIAEFDPDIFHGRFGFAPNAVQSAACKAAASGAKLIIIEAPMGIGKTEAALGCAEIMASQNGSGGLYIGLPTQATANGIFNRMLSWAEKTTGRPQMTVNLAHRGASFHEAFRNLSNIPHGDARLSVNRWMTEQYRKLMSDFTDGTLDQAASMSLNRRFFALSHAQLAGKTVIFDEVHAYDAYTSAYLSTTLAYLGAYGCPVVLLSATLTQEKRKAFLAAYTQNAGLPDTDTDAYPCITWWDGRSIHTDTVPKETLRHTDFRLEWLECGDLAKTLKSVLADGGCAGVIRNTVGEAVRTYETLKTAMPEYRIILLHSRFLMDDRSRLEQQVLSLTGKRSTPHDRDRLIVVGTQVLEQSLDLDFDTLATDPCPMDLLLQRLGREHRHDRPRPEKLTDARVYLLRDGKKITGDHDRPYSSYMIDRACRLVAENGGRLSLPDSISPMVDAAYDLSLTDASREKDEYIKKNEAMQNNSARMRIPEPWNLDSIRGLAHLPDTQEDGIRKGGDSVTVLLLVERNGRIEDVYGMASCRAGERPGKAVTELCLRQELRIPGHMVSEEELAAMKDRTGFGDTGIWAYKDILLLDDDLTYTHKGPHGRETYRYSPETGLTKEL